MAIVLGIYYLDFNRSYYMLFEIIEFYCFCFIGYYMCGYI